MSQEIGTTYKAVIASLGDDATIVEAFKYYHDGGLSGSVLPNSIEYHLTNVNDRVDVVDGQLGYNGVIPTPSSVQSRLSTLEGAIGSSLASTYVKMIPSSNDTNATRNLITPSTSTIVPLTIQGVISQSADLQQWKTNAATVAKVDSSGKIFSYDGTSMAETATISGNQTLTNKTLTNPITTIGTNARTASYGLVSGDQSKLIEVSSTSATTVTIPDESVTTIFPIGTYIVVLQTNSGQVTIAGSGFTPSATPGLKLRTQWSMATLIKRATNSWVVAGDLTT